MTPSNPASFTADPGLPTLHGAMSPEEIGPLFVAIGLASPSLLSSPQGRVTVDVLRYRPRTRCVIRYTLEDPTRTTPQELIGKVYRTPKRAAAAWRAHTGLSAHGSSITIRFPTPLALVEDRCLVLMENVAGDTMRDRLLADTRTSAERLVVLAGDALAELHSLDLDLAGERSASIAVEVASVRDHIERIAFIAPHVARRASDLLDDISVVAGRHDCVPSRLLHGDYTPSQLIVGTGPVTIVDFDRVGFGDPAVDLGNFMAKLVRDAVLADRDHLRKLRAVFLDTYVARCSNEAAQRAIVMQSLVIIRVALSRLQHAPASHDVVDQLLGEATACLAMQ